VLGPERNALMHRFRDFLDSEAVLVASTDAPISPWSPLETIHVAVNRREVGSDSPPFNFEQRLTLPEVIAAYTINGAYANFMDRESGSLEVGKRADFVMLDRNLFEIDPEEIHAVRILWTMLDGREVFRAEDW
jgi:predicted amidohydrolase YtcJ